MKILVKKPVNGGTPAIEKRDMESKKRELEFKLNPEKALSVLLVEIKIVDTTQKNKIRVIL